MTKSFKATWLGDADPFQQVVDMWGLSFVKGEATDVPADHPKADVIRKNPMFSVEKDAAPIASDEPERPDPEAGTELASAKAEAVRLGIKLQGNPGLDTVRGKIAAHLEKAE